MDNIINTFTMNLISITNGKFFFTIEKSRLPINSLLEEKSRQTNLVVLPFSTDVMKLIQRYFYILNKNVCFIKEKIGWPDLISTYNVIEITESDIKIINFYDKFIDTLSSRDCPLSIAEETLIDIKDKMNSHKKVQLLPNIGDAYVATYTYIYMLSIYLKLDFIIVDDSKKIIDGVISFEKDFTTFKNISFISKSIKKLDNYSFCIVDHIKIHRSYQILTTFKWNEMSVEAFNDIFKIKDRLVLLFKFALNEYSLIKDLIYFKICLTNIQHLTLPNAAVYQNICRVFDHYNKNYVIAIYKLLLALKDHEYVKDDFIEKPLYDFSEQFPYKYIEDWLTVDGFSRENLSRIFN